MHTSNQTLYIICPRVFRVGKNVSSNNLSGSIGHLLFQTYKVGPGSSCEWGEITLRSRMKSPQLPIYMAIYRVITPFNSWVITQFITGRDPPCTPSPKCSPILLDARELLKHGHEVGTLSDALNCISKEGVACDKKNMML